MSLHRGIDGSEPIGSEPLGRFSGVHEERRVLQSELLATGTLACPRCDAPVALSSRVASPADPLGCPFCGHAGAIRDFLSLATPSRPARVHLRVVERGRPAAQLG